MKALDGYKFGIGYSAVFLVAAHYGHHVGEGLLIVAIWWLGAFLYQLEKNGSK